jgi:hypothetical protein
MFIPILLRQSLPTSFQEHSSPLSSTQILEIFNCQLRGSRLHVHSLKILGECRVRCVHTARKYQLHDGRVKARLSSFHASGFSNSTQLRPDISPTLSNIRSVSQSSHHHIYHIIALGLLEAAHLDAAQRSCLSPPKERYEKRLFSQPRMKKPHALVS